MPAPLPTLEKHLIEQARSQLVMRWLVVMMAAYLTMLSKLADYFPGSSGVVSSKLDFTLAFSLLFVLTNVICELMPRRMFVQKGVQKTIRIVDAIFVSVALYMLRVPGNYLYLGFVFVFILAVIWPEIKIVFLAIIVVSVLYGVFTSFQIFSVDRTFVEAFLTLGLFFVVSVLYLFLSDRLKQDAILSSIVLSEKRRAHVMAEITRSLSSSLNSGKILSLIVTRLSEVMDATECRIVRMGTKGAAAEVMVTSAPPGEPDPEFELGKYPEIVHAHESKELVFVSDLVRGGVHESAIAAPMLAQDTVMGVIHIRLDATRTELPEEDARFLEIMAGTAANALRNAQLFEEMEHRARTDFLTGLANHRSFQSTLAIELGRAQRHNHSLSLLIIDLDFLKEVNDRFGHPAGDTVIRSVAETIRSVCREFDFAARYGGEEFMVILPETPLTGAVQVADRIRERIAEIPFPGMGNVTASIGVSNYPVNALDKEDMIRVADRALYVAKNGGRDRVAYFNYQLVTL